MESLSKTILLVEDEAVIALLEKKWLTKEGFNVICTVSAEEAIDIIKTGTQQIDLILMDIDLGTGRMDGIDAAAVILKNNDIPLLFLSSHTEKEIAGRTELIPSYGYVVKGANDTALLASIKMAFKLHSANKDLKRKEKELLERERMMESFFGQSLDGFFFMMLDEPVTWNDSVDKEKVMEYVFAHHRITKINGAMLEQYKATSENFINLTPNDLFAHDISYGKEVWTKFFDEGHLHIETEERKFDGSIMFVEGDYICLYDEEGRITGHFGIQREVTQQKQMHETLLRMNASKDKLFSILAHDLKGPFAGFMGLTETLALNLNSLSEKDIVEYASAMNTTSKRLFELLNNLLEWSRLQTDKFEFTKTPLDLNYEVNKIKNLFASASAEKSITIVNSVDDDMLIYSDIKVLTIVLTNLISNAVKFTYPGGKITVCAEQKDNIVVFSVTDTGVGMSKTAAEKVFQIDSGYTTAGTNGEKGSGLGLTLCKELIEALGGTFEVSSIPGQGSTFKFTIPAIDHEQLNAD